MLDVIANIFGESLFIKSNKRKAPILGIILFIIVIVGFIYTYRRNAIQTTEKEMDGLINEIKVYYESNETYPKSIEDIIINKPLKSKFRNDYWLNNYYYNIEKGIIISKGSDGVLNTKDDIIKRFK